MHLAEKLRSIPFRRSDIPPLIILVAFNSFSSGFVQILSHDLNNPELELDFVENYAGPVLWWPGWTLLSYGAIIAWRTQWFEKVVTGLLEDRQRIKEKGFWSELKREFSGMQMPNKRKDNSVRVITRDDLSDRNDTPA